MGSTSVRVAASALAIAGAFGAGYELGTEPSSPPPAVVARPVGALEHATRECRELVGRLTGSADPSCEGPQAITVDGVVVDGWICNGTWGSPEMQACLGEAAKKK